MGIAGRVREEVSLTASRACSAVGLGYWRGIAMSARGASRYFRRPYGRSAVSQSASWRAAVGAHAYLQRF